MDHNTFNDLFKDMMTHIFDYVSLETHPLAEMVEPLPGGFDSRAEYIQQVIKQGIERLRPPGDEPMPDAPEWRPYMILLGRYVEGVSPKVLANQLHISGRQLRRDHSRALQALSVNIWNNVFHKLSQDDTDGNSKGYELQSESLDLNQVTQGVIDTLRSYAQSDGVEFQFVHPPTSMTVLTDRIILRQILFTLGNYAFSLEAGQKIEIRANQISGKAEVCIRVWVDNTWEEASDDEREDAFRSLRYWVEQIGAELVEEYPSSGRSGQVVFKLSVLVKERPVILVVDDQQPALRMYQRYLAQIDFDVIGVSDSTRVMQSVEQLKPVLILLDVMMPNVDGWEVLQELRLNAETKEIPVIICSAWEATELAKSLGAADFLKKPVTQKGLLASLMKLDPPILDKLGE
ncbi:MAG: response regulator [Anaerolineales bacterium]|nr:response regulator [Anaerolineales bacterium]